MAWLAPLSGLALLLLLAWDVFITVFHPQGHGGPVTRVHGRLLWGVWKAAPLRGASRERWLALAAPSLAIATIAVWAVLVVLGYALLYLPWMERFLVSPGSLRAPWWEAVYYSGFVAVSLGNGDLVPDPPVLRMLTVVNALSGFAVLSSAITYMLSVFRENGRKTALAGELALHFDGAAPGAAEGTGGRMEAGWLLHVARELKHVQQAHAQYPILHYFRPADESQSLPVQLAPLVLGADGDVEGPGKEGMQPRREGARVADGRRARAIASRAVDQYLTAADHRFVPGEGPEAPGADAADLHDRWRRLLVYMAYDPAVVGGPGDARR